MYPLQQATKNFHARSGPVTVRPVASCKCLLHFHIRLDLSLLFPDNVLFSLFCCCLRPRRHFLPLEPNENTPLIPASDDVQPASRHIIDQQRMKERLGMIVRAKESKMVNVNAPLPFNLTTNGNKQPRLSRLSTRSPQPSLDMERQSVASSASASASASHELDEDTRRPTLNVRIVRGGSLLARGRPITRDAATVVHDSRTEEGENQGRQQQ
ncbi:hypothetical protein BJV77DRAFT_349119 [Russula vinacea]|nr:hypothetical protein BJV77DRAFT_349119 [Russula vinacea]